MNKRAFFVLLIAIVMLFSSCERNNRNNLERESLFSIPLGKMADEIDYFQRDNFQFSSDNDLVMKDGFFYISNGRSGKLMKFNNYGNLFTLIYNPDRNPYPAELFSRNSDNTAVNRQVVMWQFNSPGFIAVAENDIYVVDTVSANRRIIENGILKEKVILHFDENGEYKDFIGLEGVGGLPFPYIENIWVSDLSELIVLFRTSESWFANWYTINGSLRYSVEIKVSSIPLPAGETDLIISLDNVIPDRSCYELYLKLTYFKKNVSESLSGMVIDEIFGGIYNLNVTESRYYGWTRLPENKILLDEMEIDSPYILIGSFKGYLLFISHGEPGTYKLLISNEKGEFEQEKILLVEEEDVIFKDFFLSQEGILNAMFFTEEEAKIMWWRTDKLINGIEDRE